MDPRELDRDIAGAANAHQRLLATLDTALDAPGSFDPRRPSALPGWTVGHVLTHLARHADSAVRALDGEPQYAGGSASRAADIEAGSGRTAEELVADVRRSIWALEMRWAAAVDWDAASETSTGAVLPVSDVPFRRWRETEIHHVDLDLGVGFEDLPSEYVRLELRRLEMTWRARRPMGMTELPSAALAAPPARRLAWLTGRGHLEGLGPAGVF